MSTSERQAKLRVHTGSCVAAVSATGSVPCNAYLLARICAFQYGYPLLVRPLVEPPCAPLPSRYPPPFTSHHEENPHEYRLGVFPARAAKVGNIKLLSALQRVVEHYREYERYEVLSFCGVIRAAIEAGAVNVLTWAHKQGDAFSTQSGGWTDQCFSLFPRRVSSQVLAWLDTHRPELYRNQGRYAIEATIRRGHVDVLRYCYRHAPEAFHPVGGLKMNGGSLQAVRFLLEETSVEIRVYRFREHVTQAVGARYYYWIDYLRRHFRQCEDKDMYTRLMDQLFMTAVENQWTDVIEYMKTIGEWTDD